MSSIVKSTTKRCSDFVLAVGGVAVVPIEVQGIVRVIIFIGLIIVFSIIFSCYKPESIRGKCPTRIIGIIPTFILETKTASICNDRLSTGKKR